MEAESGTLPQKSWKQIIRSFLEFPKGSLSFMAVVGLLLIPVMPVAGFLWSAWAHVRIKESGGKLWERTLAVIGIWVNGLLFLLDLLLPFFYHRY